MMENMGKNNPIISVVIPMYNVEKYIRRCLESVVGQTFTDFEVIVVNDCSPDGSKIIAEEFVRKDARFRIIDNDVNIGLGYTRNAGIDNARGAYICFLDSDDYYELDALEQWYSKIVEFKCDACALKLKYVYADGKTVERGSTITGLFEGQQVIDEIVINICGLTPREDKQFGLSSCISMYSVDLIRKNNIRFLSEREYLSEDTIFIAEFFSKARKVYVDNIYVYNYMQNFESLTNNFDLVKLDRTRVLFKKINDVCDKVHFSENPLSRINGLYIMYIRAHLKKVIRAKKFSFREKRQIIKRELFDEQLIEAYKLFPYNEAHFFKRTIHHLMKKKHWFLLFLCFKIYKK